MFRSSRIRKLLLVAVTLVTFAAFAGSSWAESGCHDRGRTEGGGTTTVAGR